LIVPTALVGARDNERTLLVVTPFCQRLSVKVGYSTVAPCDVVPRERRLGPRPRTPSTPAKPVEELATPIAWLET